MLMMNIPAMTILFSLSWIVGMGIYSVYSDCDPYEAGYTQSRDAILPFYVEDKFSFVPGLMGIFLSTLFNSALILNVSNLNSLATVTWEDFLSKLPQFKGMEDKKQLHIIKFIGSIYGLMILGVGFLVGLLTGVIESAQLMTSATSGPLLGETGFSLAQLFYSILRTFQAFSSSQSSCHAPTGKALQSE
jgi:solute carrier family 5 (sodium-coupled monocarboxylate transporter), member 8/12